MAVLADVAGLRDFGPGLWLADGSQVSVGGFVYPTRAAIIRLGDGDLLVWSPIALSDALRGEIDALGPLRHIVAPNALHHVFIADWQAAWPQARTYAPPRLRGKRPDIAFDADIADTPLPAWDGVIDQVLMQGNAITDEIVFFHRPSGTVLFTDLIQHFPPDWFSGWRAIVARFDLMTAAQPAVPRKFRVAFTDRRAARMALRRILAWPIRQLVMAHGAPVTDNAETTVRAAFRWLSR